MKPQPLAASQAQQAAALIRSLKAENKDLKLRLRVTTEVLAVEIHTRCVLDDRASHWNVEVGKTQRKIQDRLRELRADFDWETG